MAGRPRQQTRLSLPRCAVEFGGDGCATVALKDWGPLADNRLALSAAVANPGNKPFRGRWQVRSDSETIQHGALFELKPGATLPIRLEEPIQDPATSLIGFEVFQEQAEQPLFRRAGRGERSPDSGDQGRILSERRHLQGFVRCGTIAAFPWPTSRLQLR